MEDDDQDKDKDQGQKKDQSVNEETQVEEENIENQDLSKEWRSSKDHPIQNVIGYIFKTVTTRHSLRKVCNHMIFVSQIELKEVDEALIDKYQSLVMQEKLSQFERNKI